MWKSKSAHRGHSTSGAGGSGWQATVSACCASLLGIGLARFAYTPLLPAIISAHWFAPSAASYLGAANLAGYLAGALLGRPMAAKVPLPALLRALMLLATIAFFACSVPLSLTWFFIWRLLSGISGGAFVFTHSDGNYHLIFDIGALAFIASRGIDLIVGVSVSRRRTA